MTEPEQPKVIWSDTSLLILQGRAVIAVPQEMVPKFAADVQRQAARLQGG